MDPFSLLRLLRSTTANVYRRRADSRIANRSVVRRLSEEQLTKNCEIKNVLFPLFVYRLHLKWEMRAHFIQP